MLGLFDVGVLTVLQILEPTFHHAHKFLQSRIRSTLAILEYIKKKKFIFIIMATRLHLSMHLPLHQLERSCPCCWAG